MSGTVHLVDTFRPAESVTLKLGLDWPVLTAAYAMWQAQGLFRQISWRHPDATLKDFLDWNYDPAHEPVGCYVGDRLLGIGWICQAWRIDGRVSAEVGAAFLKGTPLSLWHRALDLLLRHAFVDRKFDTIYGLCPVASGDARMFVEYCRMRPAETATLPWGEKVPADMIVCRLDRAAWEFESGARKVA